jgi:hypothetical protein
MFKPSNNPKVLELTKSCTSRHLNLDLIQPLISPEGIKLCAWCLSVKTKGPKYCGKDCAKSARAHFYPQNEESLNYLLIRQDFKCADCKYDWKPLIEQLLINGRVYDKPKDYKTELSYWLMRRIKSKSPKEYRPEVDHIIPIYKGGTPLGQENHQILCFSCHKAKSKVDNSGKRTKK